MSKLPSSLESNVIGPLSDPIKVRERLCQCLEAIGGLRTSVYKGFNAFAKIKCPFRCLEVGLSKGGLINRAELNVHSLKLIDGSNALSLPPPISPSHLPLTSPFSLSSLSLSSPLSHFLLAFINFHVLSS